MADETLKPVVNTHTLSEMRRNPERIRDLFREGKYPYRNKIRRQTYDTMAQNGATQEQLDQVHKGLTHAEASLAQVENELTELRGKVGKLREAEDAQVEAFVREVRERVGAA